MPHYILLLRHDADGLKSAREDPAALLKHKQALLQWEAKIIASYFLLGEYDQCLIIDAPNNFKAYRSTLVDELSTVSHAELLPAIDLPLWQRLMSQSTETLGPYRWQVQWWARLILRASFYFRYVRKQNEYFESLTVTGREKLKKIKGPCIVIANHASHLDTFALIPALPAHIRSNLYFGSAADRWFLKGRKEFKLQPWYSTLTNGIYPIKRGGGSAALDYPKWLLSKGSRLALFPEGTRTRGRGLGKFKYGVAILALEHNIPVIPVYLDGLGKLRPPGTREAVRGHVGAYIQDPVYFEPGTSVPDATQQLFEIMTAAETRAFEAAEATEATEAAQAPANESPDS